MRTGQRPAGAHAAPAGEPLGIAVYPVGIDAEPEAVPYQNSVITAEIERWPETALTRELATHSAFVNRDIFPRARRSPDAKQLLDQLGLATAPWQLLAGAAEWPQVFASLGELAIVKRRVGGYDGAANGACARPKPNCRPMPMASASSSKASISPAKCRWWARAATTAVRYSTR